MGVIVLNRGRRRHTLGAIMHARREYASNVRSGPRGFGVSGDLNRNRRIELRHRGVRSALQLKTGPDPSVCARQAVAKAHLRFPVCDPSENSVVAIAPANTLWLRGRVDLHEILAGGLTNQVREPVDGDQFVSSNVDRLGISRGHESDNPLRAVVNVTETARLQAVAPNLDCRSIQGLSHLSTNCSRGLLSATLERPEGSEDVVEPCDSDVQPLVFVIIPG